MTDAEKIETAADKFVFECPKYSGYPEHVKTFKAGVAWRDANPNEKVQALVEALEKLAAHCGREWCDVCDERSLHCELGGAQEAIKKWRGE